MAEWRDMTMHEWIACRAIRPGRIITFPVGSPPKRLARSLHDQSLAEPARITDKQANALWRLVWRFRKALIPNNNGLVKEAMRHGAHEQLPFTQRLEEAPVRQPLNLKATKIDTPPPTLFGT